MYKMEEMMKQKHSASVERYITDMFLQLLVTNPLVSQISVAMAIYSNNKNYANKIDTKFVII